MEIHAVNLEQLLEIVQGLVQRGLGFRADAGALKVTLTGAY